MKKEITVTALCIALAALSGCSGSDAPSEAVSDLATVEQALFGEIGGLPYGSAPSQQLTLSNAAVNDHLGRSLAIGDINTNGYVDIVTATGSAYSHGRVVLLWDNGGSQSTFEMSSNGADGFGSSLAVGQFCPELAPSDMVIASAPGYNGNRGALGFIYRADKRIKLQKKLTYPGDNMERMGEAIAVGDVNGDGLNDLVYSSWPLDAEYNYEKPKLNVMLDLCHASNVTATDSVTAESPEFQLGSSIHIVDLDGKGTKEIVVVDNLYRTADNPGAANGAIFFYVFKGGKLTQSRPAIIGDRNKSAASIESVAFSDLNGDGLIDLVVGEPMWNESYNRQGQVRTYTNKGIGNAFGAESLWTATGDRSNVRLGSHVTVADLNHDGVNDLIVSAPGFRKSGTDQATGAVYIYMGTNDGTVFSEKPFWSYVSAVSTTLNDDFGRRILTASIDKNGWEDLIIAAPNYSLDATNKDQGRIFVFNEKDNFCYTASRCLIDGKCYEADDMPASSKCQVCKPKEHNFEWSAVSCTGAETACQNAATCDDSLGCTMTNKPDGTSCGSASCNASNNYVTRACQSGVCKSSTKVCSGMGCDPASGCLSGCNSAADCGEGYSCDTTTHTCVNLPPVISLSDYSVKLGATINVKASYTDPEGDVAKYTWAVTTPAANVSVTNTSTLTAKVHAGNNANVGDKMVLRLTLDDTHGNVVTADSTITVVGLNLTMASPVNGATLDNYNVTFSGTIGTTGGAVLVLNPDDDSTLCSATIQSNGSWSCSYTYDSPGSHKVYARWNRNAGQKTDPISFSFADPNAKLNITAPTNGQTLNDTAVTIAGKIDSYITYVNGSVIVDTTSGTRVCTANISYNSWTCNTTLTPGQYSIVAYKADDKALKSSAVSFTVADPTPANKPPVIVLNSEYSVYPGGSTRINASKTYDPEGDPITFAWTGPDASKLSSTQTKNPVFYAPEDAVPGDVYHLTLTATDDKKASSSFDVKVNVVAPPYVINIVSPYESEIVTANTIVVSGTTDMPNGQSVVVHYGSGEPMCTADVVDGAWSCSAPAAEGDYTIYATWSASEAISSGRVNFTVSRSVENKPPFIVLEDVFEAHAGDVFVLDASDTYDPDGDKLWFEWSGDYVDMLSGVNDSSPIISIPASAKPGDAYDFLLTVTDDKDGVSQQQTVVKVIGGETEYFIRITKPMEETGIYEEVGNPVTISGVATPDVDIYVLNRDTKDLVCEANSDPQDGAWSCSKTFDNGDYGVIAYVEVNGKAVAESGVALFSVEDGISYSTPVIESPKDGDVTSIRPTASGTVSADDGMVYVWTVKGDVATLFCTAEIVDHKWICTVGYNLENDTEYTIRASWSDGGDHNSSMSDPVTFKTQSADVAQISVISPAQGAVLPDDYPVIVSGTAQSGTVVDVYLDKVPVCTVKANENNHWACPDIARIGIGEHEVYADDAGDDKIIPSNTVVFTIKAGTSRFVEEYNDVSGGSCSVSTVPGSGHFGWLFLLAGFAGIGVARRRRD